MQHGANNIDDPLKTPYGVDKHYLTVGIVNTVERITKYMPKTMFSVQ